MKFSDGEKVIALMLCELYDKLGVDGEIDHDFLRSAIQSDARSPCKRTASNASAQRSSSTVIPRNACFRRS